MGQAPWNGLKGTFGCQANAQMALELHNKWLLVENLTSRSERQEQLQAQLQAELTGLNSLQPGS